MSKKANRSIRVVVVVMVMMTGISCGPSAKIRRLMREHHNRPDTSPAVGTQAPNFRLHALDGRSDVELVSFRGKKPVVLVFGSYT